jgi:hypothetical protein
MDPTGELLIRWSVRLAMLCYLAVLAQAIASQRAPATSQSSRWIWTAGCLLFLGHMASAFHYYHHWNHAHAFADTAERTQKALGWEFGWGIYFNHLFAVVWAADVAWSWLSPGSFAARPRWVTISIHAFLLFIAINGLAVFKGGAVRWITLAAAAGLAVWWLARFRARMMPALQKL